MKKIVVIHTTPTTIAPIGNLIAEQLGDCSVYNLLDDSILPEINEAGCITPGVRARLYAQLGIAQTIGPDVILCACSSIGKVMEEGSTFCAVPVLRIDGPMAAAAVADSSRIAVLATLASTLEPTTELIRRKAQESGKTVELSSSVIEGAGALLKNGDTEGYDRLVAGVILEKLQTSEVVLLAQASMARCLPCVPRELHSRVFTSPASGVAQLKNY